MDRRMPGHPRLKPPKLGTTNPAEVSLGRLLGGGRSRSSNFRIILCVLSAWPNESIQGIYWDQGIYGKENYQQDVGEESEELQFIVHMNDD